MLTKKDSTRTNNGLNCYLTQVNKPIHVIDLVTRVPTLRNLSCFNFKTLFKFQTQSYFMSFSLLHVWITNQKLSSFTFEWKKKIISILSTITRTHIHFTFVMFFFIVISIYTHNFSFTHFGWCFLLFWFLTRCCLINFTFGFPYTCLWDLKMFFCNVKREVMRKQRKRWWSRHKLIFKWPKQVSVWFVDYWGILKIFHKIMLYFSTESSLWDQRGSIKDLGGSPKKFVLKRDL